MGCVILLSISFPPVPHFWSAHALHTCASGFALYYSKSKYQRIHISHRTPTYIGTKTHAPVPQRNEDLLTALVSSSGLTGSCNGISLPLLVTARECTAASSESTCAAAASGRCQWLTRIGVCTIRENPLPSLALDPSDRWVAVFNNATALCRSITNASLCGAAIDIAEGVQNGGSSGGSGTTAVITWCLLAAATAIAAALSHLVPDV
ncbi:hypothetical protein Vafri_14277 [Volvox africanus]|uniref:Uncharacterized protein n=1 Tax=Volvox africanus TaxID=51714 RepID=A0A8J4F4A0_9CHLO|nr:hypothetical protein Vafri_14277 [Volvox africanus]